MKILKQSCFWHLTSKYQITLKFWIISSFVEIFEWKMLEKLTTIFPYLPINPIKSMCIAYSSCFELEKRINLFKRRRNCNKQAFEKKSIPNCRFIKNISFWLNALGFSVKDKKFILLGLCSVPLPQSTFTVYGLRQFPFLSLSIHVASNLWAVCASGHWFYVFGPLSFVLVGVQNKNINWCRRVKTHSSPAEW